MWRKTTSFKPVNIFKSFFGLISPNIYTFKKKKSNKLFDNRI